MLVVGQRNPQIQELERNLAAHGVKVEHLDCAAVSAESIGQKTIDLVILNHLEDGDDCLEIFNVLQGLDLRGTLPVFALIADAEREIQNVLSLGAADYITTSEDTASVTQKIKAVFGQGLGYSAIDITPTEVAVSKSGLRVYVVEDDPLLRNLLSIRFEKAEFIYKVNGDGDNVVAEVVDFKPAIIILDLMLPGKDGFEVLQELKADEQTKDLPVIVFSNRDGTNDKKRAEELGAAGFYVKAMTDLSELIKKIEALT